MIIITCHARLHRAEERIFLAFPFNAALNNLLRKTSHAKWSQTHKQWHLPMNKTQFDAFRVAVRGLAEIDTSPLKSYLDKKKPFTPVEINKTAAAAKETVTVKPFPVAKPAKIDPVNLHVLPAFKQQLVLKAYSQSTIKTYLNEMAQFLQHLKTHAADEFSVGRIRRYLQYCFETLALSEHTLHSRINALKFYYEQVLGKEKFFWEVPRPKKPFQLPKLLNESELARLFNSLTNRKHKAMLFTAYSAGLRVSEVVNLKLADIDSRRMQVLVQHGKGKKDRYVNLSPVLLDILRKYLSGCRPKPVVYLFESEQSQGAYPTRTVQQIFSHAKQKAGISKTVGVHSLRHSFATHLLDKGTDIRYIKDLLGHFNIKTTERYLHVSKKQLVNIISPFDDLWKKEHLDW